MCRKKRDTSRGSPRSFAAQRTLAQDDNQAHVQFFQTNCFYCSCSVGVFTASGAEPAHASATHDAYECFFYDSHRPTGPRYSVWNRLRISAGGGRRQLQHRSAVFAVERNTAPERRRCLGDEALYGDERRISGKPAAEPAARRGVAGRRSAGRQRLGTMSAGDVDAELELVRVTDPNAGKIWLISSDTLARFRNSTSRSRRGG